MPTRAMKDPALHGADGERAVSANQETLRTVMCTAFSQETKGLSTRCAQRILE